MILLLLLFHPFASTRTLGTFLAFYIFDWFCLLTKVYFSSTYVPFCRADSLRPLPSVSIIVPVADQNPEVFRAALSALTILRIAEKGGL